MSGGFHDDCTCGEPGSHALAQLWREHRAGDLLHHRAVDMIGVARADGVPWNLIAEALSLPIGTVLERYG